MSGAAAFEAERARLTRLAYRMLGERSAAEDVVQETWLRWAKTDHTEIASPAAWLTRAASRLAIDALRKAKARREDYIGPWLPEPEVAPFASDEESDDDRAERISLGFLHVLERLSPDERAAFILHDAFDCGYDEIAAALNKTEPACRKLVSRARERVRSGRPRFDTDREQQQRIVTAFLAASARGDAAAMKSLLTADAIVYSDGGGKVRAALRPLGPDDAILTLTTAMRRYAGQRHDAAAVEINGQFGLALSCEGRLHTLYTADIQGGRIAALYIVRNPDKLARAGTALAQREGPAAL